jgi:hypothetical protein
MIPADIPRWLQHLEVVRFKPLDGIGRRAEIDLMTAEGWTLRQCSYVRKGGYRVVNPPALVEINAKGREHYAHCIDLTPAQRSRWDAETIGGLDRFFAAGHVFIVPIADEASVSEAPADLSDFQSEAPVPPAWPPDDFPPDGTP